VTQTEIFESVTAGLQLDSAVEIAQRLGGIHRQLTLKLTH
jgi:hypothetical protein